MKRLSQETITALHCELIAQSGGTEGIRDEHLLNASQIIISTKCTVADRVNTVRDSYASQEILIECSTPNRSHIVWNDYGRIFDFLDDLTVISLNKEGRNFAVRFCCGTKLSTKPQ